jgi:RES domain-containing protein
MVVYRIGKTIHGNDLSGEGSKLNGGRWNQIGTSCIYTSESRALSVLEYSANVPLDLIPNSLSFTSIEIPDNSVIEFTLSDLPSDWNNHVSPQSTKNLGTVLFKKAEYLVLKIPSVIIPQEFNYLINPIHSDISKVAIKEIVDFVYDVRIKN